MPEAGINFLENSRLQKVTIDIASKYPFDDRLLFLGRTREVQVPVEEIRGRFSGQVYAADLITEDASAVTYEAGKLTFQDNAVPKLKIGARFSESLIRQLRRYQLGAALPSETGLLGNSIATVIRNLVLGIRQRKNAMICGMLLDSWTYNRFGIQISGTWGMPANLKVTAVTSWDQPTATPITDILTLVTQVAPDNYGHGYDRVTMSTKTLRYILLTNEFQALARAITGARYSTAALNTFDMVAMRSVLANILGMEVETYDAVYRELSADGKVVTTSRVLPAAKVILSRKADDGTGESYDFAQGEVMEGLIAPLIQGAPSVAGGYGPLTYATGNINLNPPTLELWSVDSGFPRKHDETASAVITAGVYT